MGLRAVHQSWNWCGKAQLNWILLALLLCFANVGSFSQIPCFTSVKEPKKLKKYCCLTDMASFKSSRPTLIAFCIQMTWGRDGLEGLTLGLVNDYLLLFADENEALTSHLCLGRKKKRLLMTFSPDQLNVGPELICSAADKIRKRRRHFAVVRMTVDTTSLTSAGRREFI